MEFGRFSHPSLPRHKYLYWFGRHDLGVELIRQLGSRNDDCGVYLRYGGQ